VIAEKLGGRTVAEWKAVMSEDEFISWCAFFACRSELEDSRR
jgi:hypothetical protein